MIQLLSYFILSLYILCLSILMIYGLHRYWIIYLYKKYKQQQKGSGLDIGQCPMSRPDPFVPFVTVQLPLFNEKYVAERLIDAVAHFDYPSDKLEIQVLDDSTDETVAVVGKKVLEWKSKGLDIVHLRRPHRNGFKAGALADGLKVAKGEFVAIFDADFIPPADFLKKTLVPFQNSAVGMVQTRWGHINSDYSLLTRLQAIFLDGHFMLEHTARYGSGAFFNFNGTAGVWRKKTIESAGGWSSRTLTEDLDLSYRAQLNGWKFVYLSDYVCPAELPVDIHSLRSQQKRWTKGAIQVARYILKDLWTSKLSLHTKLEGSVHLTANIGYLLTILVSLLLLPCLFLRHLVHWPGVEIVEVMAFFATTISISTFYMISQKEIYPDWKVKIKDIPVLLSFGIGMCVSNAMAVFEGLLNKPSDFIRTPKYNIQSKLDRWTRKTYAKNQCAPWLPQSFFALYSMATFGVALLYKNWGAMPFIFLFLFGFTYVAGLSYAHSTKE